MKNDFIKLNNEIEIDIQKLIESRMVVQGNSGSGKSTTVRRLIEQAFGKVQIIVLDPEGEFGNMRAECDFVYIGKDGDAPAEPRSAALLARRLLELKASAIIDLYELVPQERKHFVKLFLDAMVNAPKDIWPINHGGCLVFLDEAHMFAPEKDQSESLSAVINIASLGRKRGMCLIPATQRPAKLNKDVAAECNNKLIGRASLDIDRKRSADELGFSSKEEIISLRNLEPGEFYVFGPAISRDVVKILVGDVKVKSPARGQGIRTLPPPTDKVKKILAQLADLPQAAQEEARTIAEFKAQVSQLRRELTIAKERLEKATKQGSHQPTRVEKIKVPIIGKRALDNLNATVPVLRKMLKEIKGQYRLSEENAERFDKGLDKLMAQIGNVNAGKREVTSIFGTGNPITISTRNIGEVFRQARSMNKDEQIYEKAEMGFGERKILTAIAQHPDGISREHLTVLTGYKRSSRDTYLQRLRVRGFINFLGEFIQASNDGILALGSDFSPLPTGGALREHVLRTLPEGERKILGILIEAYPETVDREALSNAVGYQRSSRDTYLQRLKARALIELEGRGLVKANRKLFD